MKARLSKMFVIVALFGFAVFGGIVFDNAGVEVTPSAAACSSGSGGGGGC